ncbi:hypothetical protein BDZ91DRAFT_762253 [Kalaharituber pfeilii]|nr:hypothetical protein BDZ91DRAFT_762253 [Kalaharituber pfeilii]
MVYLTFMVYNAVLTGNEFYLNTLRVHSDHHLARWPRCPRQCCSHRWQQWLLQPQNYQNQKPTHNVNKPEQYNYRQQYPNYYNQRYQNYNPYDANYDAIYDANENANENANLAASKSANANENDNLALGGEGYARGGEGLGFSAAANENNIEVANANRNDLGVEVANFNKNLNEQQQEAAAISAVDNLNDAESFGLANSETFAETLNDNESASLSDSKNENADYTALYGELANALANQFSPKDKDHHKCKGSYCDY